MIEILYHQKVVASFLKDNRNFIIDYKDFDIKNSISLSLPNTQKIYLYDYRFPPFLESFLPEGYLYEIFKNILSKEHGKVDDYLIFSLLSSNIQSRVEFQSNLHNSLEFPVLNIEEILANDTNDTFSNLLQTFLSKNAISGVQPKTIALLNDKDKLDTKEYIIKTWGDEYPDLALNEYFCLRAVAKAGIKTGIITSENTKIVANRAKKLKVNYLYQGLEHKGKLDLAQEICQQENISLDEVAYIGDDINCKELLQNVGLAACPANALDEIKNIPNIIKLSKCGGDGAVREFVEIMQSNL